MPRDRESRERGQDISTLWIDRIGLTVTIRPDHDASGIVRNTGYFRHPAREGGGILSERHCNAGADAQVSRRRPVPGLALRIPLEQRREIEAKWPDKARGRRAVQDDYRLARQSDGWGSLFHVQGRIREPPRSPGRPSVIAI